LELDKACPTDLALAEQECEVVCQGEARLV